MYLRIHSIPRQSSVSKIYPLHISSFIVSAGAPAAYNTGIYSNVMFQKISILFPSQKVFKIEPSPHWKFWFSFIFSLKTIGFWDPLLVGISINLLWGGYGYFLELHNDSTCSAVCPKDLYVSGMCKTGFILASPEIRSIAEKIRQSYIDKNIKRYRPWE